MQRFRGGLVFKAHRLSYHSTLGVRLIKKKKASPAPPTAKPRSIKCSRGARPAPPSSLHPPTSPAHTGSHRRSLTVRFERNSTENLTKFSENMVKFHLNVSARAILDEKLEHKWSGLRGAHALIFKAHRLLYHSTVGLRVIKKKKGRDISPACFLLPMQNPTAVGRQ